MPLCQHRLWLKGNEPSAACVSGRREAVGAIAASSQLSSLWPADRTGRKGGLMIMTLSK